MYAMSICLASSEFSVLLQPVRKQKGQEGHAQRKRNRAQRFRMTISTRNAYIHHKASIPMDQMPPTRPRLPPWAWGGSLLKL